MKIEHRQTHTAICDVFEIMVVVLPTVGKKHKKLVLC